MSTTYTGLQKAVQCAGGVQSLANFLKVPHTILVGWLHADGTDVPSDASLRQANPSLAKVIEAAGSQAALATELGVSSQAVQQWVHQGFVPSGRAQQIENTYGIPRGELVSPKLRNAMGIGGDL